MLLRRRRRHGYKRDLTGGFRLLECPEVCRLRLPSRGPLPRVLAGFLVASVAQAQGTAVPKDGLAFLQLGIRQAEEGDFESADFALDTAVRKLSEASASKAELARTYLHLGAAYAGLGHDGNAKAKFRLALASDATVRPDPERLPARTVKLFNEELTKLRAVHQGRKAKFFCRITGSGQVDSSLNSITGTFTCTCGSAGNVPADRDCSNQPAKPFTMRRR